MEERIILIPGSDKRENVALSSATYHRKRRLDYLTQGPTTERKIILNNIFLLSTLTWWYNKWQLYVNKHKKEKKSIFFNFITNQSIQHNQLRWRGSQSKDLRGFVDAGYNV